MGPIQPALIACDVPIFYATSEGQTRRIAERLAMALRERGVHCLPVDIGSSTADYIDWENARLVVVGASIHMEKHQRVAAGFVREYAAQLSARPSVFFSVSLSAGSQDPAEVKAARALADGFGPPLGWTPTRVECFAGRLAYSQYGLIKRFMLKEIAKKEGGPTDTSHDYEFTNWEDVERLAEEIRRMVSAKPVAA